LLLGLSVKATMTIHCTNLHHWRLGSHHFFLYPIRSGRAAAQFSIFTHTHTHTRFSPSLRHHESTPRAAQKWMNRLAVSTFERLTFIIAVALETECSGSHFVTVPALTVEQWRWTESIKALPLVQKKYVPDLLGDLLNHLGFPWNLRSFQCFVLGLVLTLGDRAFLV